ncbi:MAG: signal recognition particle-docking protein FtsY [Actinomycetota bacterium]
MGVVLAVVAVVVIVSVAAVLFVRSHRARGAREAPPLPGSGDAAPAARAAQRAHVPSRDDGLGSRIRSLFAKADPGDEDWGELEQLLVRADVGPGTASRMVTDLRERWVPGADPASLVADEVITLLGGDDTALHLPGDRLAVIMVVGVNGAGKTTTIGKLAAHLARQGRKVALAGSDTFRAAAFEQLDVWAQRSGAHLVSQARGADPGAVAFDAATSSIAKGFDVLIVDTAGRLHTKTPLMDELAKVRRVIEKAGAHVAETLLVLDATTGQNGIAQARAFAGAVAVTGVALTKLDGTAKGGVVLAVREQLGVPVKMIGIGEGIGDLQMFEASAFAERLLAS